MKNFKIVDENGREFWISRHIAVAVFIYTDFEILANKRGKGTPDFQGHWNCPCGYLDFDESLEQAAAREVWEETGYKIEPDELEMFYINSDPKESNKQNVTARFKAHVKNMQLQNLGKKNAEHEEVEQIAWIKLNNIDQYKWAFNHKQIIEEWIKK